MYGEWVPHHVEISQWLLFIGSIILAFDMLVAFTMRALEAR